MYLKGIKFLKALFDCYLRTSIHVGLSVAILTQTTVLILKLPRIENAILGFIFCGTIVFYNIIKHVHLRLRFFQMLFWQQIFCVSAIAFLLQVFLFFNIDSSVQMQFVAIGIGTFCYPFFRKIAFVKIFFVAFCITVVTAVVPICVNNFSFTDYALFLCTRFLLLFCLLLPFEIRDSKIDKKTLKTIPSQFGIQNTKHLGYSILLLLFVIDMNLKLLIVLLLIAFGIYKSNAIRAKYLYAFWIESIPIIYFTLYYY